MFEIKRIKTGKNILKVGGEFIHIYIYTLCTMNQGNKTGKNILKVGGVYTYILYIMFENKGNESSKNILKVGGVYTYTYIYTLCTMNQCTLSSVQI